MAGLTHGEIRQALKRVEVTGKQQNLVNDEGRGTGRLVLIVRAMPLRVIADWMAQQWRDGRRVKKKLGAYPSMSLAQAREVFKRDYADATQKGRSIKISGDARPGTVGDLFEGYVASLKSVGKPSWKEAEKGLDKELALACHQVHGAMGFTQEHALHFATRRLWSWRDECGAESFWQEWIGRTVCRNGGAALWPSLVERARAGTA